MKHRPVPNLKPTEKSSSVHKAGVAGLVLAVFAAVCVMAIPSPAAADRLSEFRGMNGGNIWDAGAAQANQALYMQQLNSKWARINIFWADMEGAGKGQYRTDLRDGMNRMIAYAQARGMKVILTTGIPPAWASRGCPTVATCAGNYRQYPPKNNQDYADFMRWVASMHVGKGLYYQVWNEPNIKSGWFSAPYVADPGGYTNLLKATHNAVKSVDPSANIVLAGLSQSGEYGGGMPAYKFLHRVYASGGKPYFMAVANHMYPKRGSRDPYAPCPLTRQKRLIALCGVKDVYDIMKVNGDGHKDLYVTEVGWSTYTGAEKVTETEQAVFAQRALNKLYYEHSYVDMVSWYHLQDSASDGASIRPGAKLDNYGLLRGNLSPKPAYTYWRTWVPGTPAPPPPTLFPLIHFYSATYTNHYYSTSAAIPPTYSRRENVGRVYISQVPGSSPIYRLFKGSTRSHYYTTNKRERDLAAANRFYGYRVPCSTAGCEIIGYMHRTRVKNSHPLYDAYSKKTKSHYYTMSRNLLRAAQTGANRYKFVHITGYMFN